MCIRDRINLTAQHLFFYKDGQLVMESDFVSGNSARGYDTPESTYSISYKQRHATLVGENYETPVSYWMPFNKNIGMHDATWRAVSYTHLTAGMCAGYAQANLVILPKDLAYDFLLFTQRNPKSCPLLEVSDVGGKGLSYLGKNVDIYKDIPKYRIYENGELTGEYTDCLLYTSNAEVAIPARTSWVEVIRPFIDAIPSDRQMEIAAPKVAPKITE